VFSALKDCIPQMMLNFVMSIALFLLPKQPMVLEGAFRARVI
jgi:hypothetical protein